MTLMQTTSGFQPRTGNLETDKMPMPKPNADEKRDDFIARCMKDPGTQDITGATAEEAQSRRVAACERIFDDAKKGAEADEECEMKSFSTVPEFTVDGDGEGDVAAVVATLDTIDNEGDVIPSDAIPAGMKATISFYSHDSIMGSMLGTGIPDQPPVGKGVLASEAGKLVFRGKYFMGTDRGKQAFLTAKAMGSEQPWSFAYRKVQVDAPSAELKAKGARRILSKLGPLTPGGTMEVSPVKIPGGKGTGTLSMKSAAATAPTQSVDGKEHPAEDFAHTPDREKSSTWKFPIFDADHVRDALARLNQADVPDSAKAEIRARIHAAAERFGIDAASLEKKAADLARREADLDATLAIRGLPGAKQS